jgi:hypothetical protein
MLRPGATLAVFVLVAAGAPAAEALQTPAAQAEVVGRVTDASSGEPVPGARVQVEGTDLQTLTDAEGRFVLRGVPPGPQTLAVTQLGYATVRQQINVPRQGTVTRDFQLAPSALNIPGITVTADAIGRARGELGTATVIGRDAIAAQGALTLANILELVPGVPLSPPGLDGVQQISLRGASIGAASIGAAPGPSAADLASFGTVIILDGVPLSNNANLQTLGPRGEMSLPSSSAGGGIDLRRLPASTIDRVEVIRGIPSARYGDLTQGAIVIESRAGEVDPVLGARSDRRTTSGNVLGGRPFRDHTGTLSVDLARTRLAPGFRDDDAHRVIAQLAHRWESGSPGAAEAPAVVVDTRIAYHRLAANNPEDPEVLPGRAAWSRDEGFRLSQRLRADLPLGARLTATTAVDRGRQRSFSMATRTRAVLPFTSRVDEGRAIGHYVGGSYVARLNVEGEPWFLYGRAELEREWESTWSSHHPRVGLEIRREWNRGAGYLFDMEFPPQAGFGLVGGFDRPRAFSDVAPMATTALYVDDRVLVPFGTAGLATLQAGLRVDLLHEGSHWVSSARSTVWQPRLNAEVAPLPWLRFRGGYGRTAKSPSMAALEPSLQYLDIVNVNWFANDPAERLAVLTTFIEDPANPELRHGVSTKREAGLEVALGRDAALSVVTFDDRVEGGIGMGFDPRAVFRDIYQLSDSTAGTGRPPEILEPPERTDTIPVLVHRPANNLDLAARGWEVALTLPELRQLRTRLQIQGARVTNRLSRADPDLGPQSQFDVFQLNPSVPRHPYWDGADRHGKRTLLSYRVIHQQPELGLVITTTIQHDLRESRRVHMGTDSLDFAGYLTRDGTLVPVPPERRGDPEFQDLWRTRSAPTAGRLPADWFLSLQVTKTLPLDGRFTFYAFNALDRQGTFPEPGMTPRFYPSARFGLDVTMPAEGLAWWR